MTLFFLKFQAGIRQIFFKKDDVFTRTTPPPPENTTCQTDTSANHKMITSTFAEGFFMTEMNVIVTKSVLTLIRFGNMMNNLIAT